MYRWNRRFGGNPREDVCGFTVQDELVLLQFFGSQFGDVQEQIKEIFKTVRKQAGERIYSA